MRSRVVLPFEQLGAVDLLNPTVYSAWLGAKRLRLSIKNPNEFKSLTFDVIMGYTVRYKKKYNRTLVHELQRKIDDWMMKDQSINLKNPLKPEDRMPV